MLAISAAIVAKLYDADNTVISMMLAGVLELSSKDGGKHHQKARKCGSQIVFVCLMQPAVRKPYGRGKGREPKKRTARKRQRAVPPTPQDGGTPSLKFSRKGILLGCAAKRGLRRGEASFFVFSAFFPDNNLK